MCCSQLGGVSLQKFALTGVEAAFGKHGEDSESKGVKAHFRVDDSGILTLEKVSTVEPSYDTEPH